MQMTHWLEFSDGEHRQRVILTAPNYSIGRDGKCDIPVSDQFVSRHHATLVRMEQDDCTFRYHIIDGRVGQKLSANGILVNGHRATNHLLQHLDEIAIGHTYLTYYLGSVPPDEPEAGLLILR